MAAAASWRELRNRWAVYLEVRLRGLGRRFRPGDLVAEIGRIEHRDPFAALWGIENLGYRYAESERRRGADPRQLFDPARVGELPARALPMLHAGVGLSLSRAALAAAADHGEAALRVAALLGELSRPGQRTAAVECLGLIARFFHPRRLGEVAARLAAGAPEVVAPFWHGVGRCHYFLLAEMLPRRGGWSRMLDRVEREAPPGAPRANALAGLAWALVLVNQRHPAVVEAFLRRQGERLLAGGGGTGNEAAPADAFASGVAAACAVRELTSPGHPVTARFLAHRPSAELAEGWRQQVAAPGRWGIDGLLPELRRQGRVSDLCRYHRPFAVPEERPAPGLSWARMG